MGKDRADLTHQELQHEFPFVFRLTDMKLVKISSKTGSQPDTFALGFHLAYAGEESFATLREKTQRIAVTGNRDELIRMAKGILDALER